MSIRRCVFSRGVGLCTKRRSCYGRIRQLPIAGVRFYLFDIRELLPSRCILGFISSHVHSSVGFLDVIHLFSGGCPALSTALMSSEIHFLHISYRLRCSSPNLQLASEAIAD